MTRPAKVYLVGAGPGHPELLTIKAAELIKAADVIVYDRLIQEEVLALAKPAAERIYMGKPVGKHDSRQDEVHDLLVRRALEGKMVVRLKGGDPFVFGRGGEEAEYLAEHGVPFEVIPGVCSALSAPLSAGIPVTHRDAASAVAIVTGHSADSARDRLDWSALARVDTLVFLMAVHNVESIAARLIRAGRSPDTPAAVIQMAFWHGEQVATGSLRTIADVVRQHEIKPPATLVVGDVVRLREKLQPPQRDLMRLPIQDTRFQPGPSPNELLRMTAGGMEAQLLGWALEIRLFDYLDQPLTAYELALQLGFNAEALSEVLYTLAAMALLECRREGYGNLELASRFLSSRSPQSLRDLLLYQCGQLVRWDALAEFARRGRFIAGPPLDGALHRDACDAAARFAAPAVVDKLSCSPRSAVVVGWGANAYRDALLRRWPGLKVETCNPFRNESLAPGKRDCELVLLSGVLECGETPKLYSILDLATSHLADQGELVLLDSLRSAASLPSPELALSLLSRQIADHSYRAWTVEHLCAVLEQHHFSVVNAQPAAAGQTVVFAAKTTDLPSSCADSRASTQTAKTLSVSAT